MENKIVTTHLNDKEKTSALLAAVRDEFPDTTDADWHRMTPKGEKILGAIRHAARRMFVRSGDQSWLRIGKEFQVHYFGMNRKPGPGCDVK